MSNVVTKPELPPSREHQAPPTNTSAPRWSFLRSPEVLCSLLGFAVLLAIFALFSGRIRLWISDGPVLSPSMSGPIILSAIVVLGLTPLIWRSGFHAPAFALGSSCALVVLFISDWLTRPYSLLLAPSIRGEILLGGILGVYGIRTLGVRLASILSLPLSVLILLYSFARTAGGSLLLGDDHSAFLYRLSMLKQNFPNIPVYDSSWNGGLDSLHLFATGVMNVFFIFLPLIYSLDIARAYTAIVAISLFALVPVFSYLAARIIRLSPAVASLAAVLSISQSLFFYRWGLVYGTMGFLVASALLPLVFAILLRVLEDTLQISWAKAATLTIAMSLMLCWPLAGLPLVPVICALLLFPKQLLRAKPLIVAACTVALITAPWVYMLWSGWSVKKFISLKVPATHESAETTREFQGHTVRTVEREVSLVETVKILRDATSPVNPLILVLSIAGMLLLPRRSGIVYALTSVWLVGLACIGGPLKPQLELERMLLMLTTLCCIPAAVALFSVLSRSTPESTLREPTATSRLTLVPTFLLCGFFLAGVFSTAGVVANRRIERFHLALPSFYDLAQAIERETGDGRALFAGFVLHELNQGHLAPLSSFTGKPMMASSHIHNVWTYTDIIPPEFRSRGFAGIEEFLDLWNVSLVLAHEAPWKQFFRSHPQQYQELETIGKFTLFKRQSFPDSFLLSGEGQLLGQSSSGAQFVFQSENVVLRFRHSDFVEVEGCEHISATTIYEGVEFIALSGCDLDSPVRISGKNSVTRLGDLAHLVKNKIFGSS